MCVPNRKFRRSVSFSDNVRSANIELYNLGLAGRVVLGANVAAELTGSLCRFLDCRGESVVSKLVSLTGGRGTWPSFFSSIFYVKRFFYLNTIDMEIKEYVF